jgi:hypothetical protein
MLRLSNKQLFPPCDPKPHRLALEVQSWYRQQLELEPVRFMETAGLAALVTAVADVAGFVGADCRDVVPVTNATTGVNAVLQSLQLRKGDLVLMTNATYAAVSLTVAYSCMFGKQQATAAATTAAAASSSRPHSGQALRVVVCCSVCWLQVRSAVAHTAASAGAGVLDLNLDLEDLQVIWGDGCFVRVGGRTPAACGSTHADSTKPAH